MDLAISEFHLRKPPWRERNKLIAIETSHEPFTHLIDPLLARDRQLSEMLVDCLIHELDLKKDEVKE